MEFPKSIFVHFVAEESYDDGGFLTIEKSAEESIDGNGPTKIATYQLVEVNEGIREASFSATDASIKVPAK